MDIASQALDTLAGVAHWQAHADQPEQALALVGLVQRHLSSDEDSKNRLAGLLAEVQAALSAIQGGDIPTFRL